MADDGILLPPGVPLPSQSPPERGTIVNETDLPDALVEEAVKDYFVEHSSLAWGGASTTFQTYIANQGSLLARTQFRTPVNVIEEIKLARELAERDDDIGSTIGSMLAMAFADGMENFHEDEKTVAIFNAACREANMDLVLAELYREYLISAQINSVSLFTRTTLDYSLTGATRSRSASVAVPLIGVLPAENVRVLDNDMFRTGQLAYEPDNAQLAMWLEKFWNPNTSAATKHAMALEDRVAATLFTGPVDPEYIWDSGVDGTYGNCKLYVLNPRLVHRTAMPKGAWKYPRPLLTRDFALLEAKRLLNIMDYALLQGGSNFIVIAKKGTDQKPATPLELQNLKEVVRTASKTGVIVGDHRLTFDIITPDLKELLNPEKRKMLGRKLAMALLRVPEHPTENTGTEGGESDLEMLARTIQFDRHLIKRHVESGTYGEMVKRNGNVLAGLAKLWFPKIILQGTQYFTDYVLKLRDRGDIPRAWAIEAAGFDYEAAVQQRRRELQSGDDQVLRPAAVPFSSPNAGPQDNNPGRTPGGTDPQQPRRQITQTTGDTIRAIEEPQGEPIESIFEDEVERVVRMGTITRAILEEFPEFEIGRITGTERAMLPITGPERRGMSIFVPVNPEYECEEYQAIRLREGLSVILGERIGDRAKVAKLIVFREPEYATAAAEDTAIRWGYPMATGVVD